MPSMTKSALVVLTALLLAGGAAAQDTRPTLTIGVQDLPPGLEPSMNISNAGQRITASIYDKFIARANWEGENGDGGSLAPSIATEWRQTSPTEWEVDIRTDVKFHNGQPMTAEDVAFSFGSELMWGPDRMIKAGTTYFGTFSEVSVVDEDTVKFVTKAPDPLFAARFTSPLGMVVPKDYFLEVGIEGFNLAPIGTGPYKLAELKQDEYIRLVANDDYWGGTPPAKEVIFREIPEEAARITGLLNGELDIIANVSPDQEAVLANSGTVQLKSVVIDNSRVIGLKTMEPPLDDKNLRKALIWGIDRQGIVDALWQGKGRLPHEFNFTSHGVDYLADRPQPVYDPVKAKEFLAASDYKGEELIFRIQGGYYANYEQVAQVLQQQWRELGINVKIEIRDTFADVTAKPVHLFAHSNGMQIPDITHPILNIFGEQGIRSRTDAAGYSWTPPERFKELMGLLETTLDHDQRIAYFKEALDIVEDEVPQIELFQAIEYYGVRNGINWKPYSFWPMDFSPRNLSFE